MESNNDDIRDMDGRKLELGHIVAVRYVWNSYVGVIRMKGLCHEGDERLWFNSPHSIKDNVTYQILGHMDRTHRDFNPRIYDWYTKPKTGYTPNIRVYNNVTTE